MEIKYGQPGILFACRHPSNHLACDGYPFGFGLGGLGLGGRGRPLVGGCVRVGRVGLGRVGASGFGIISLTLLKMGILSKSQTIELQLFGKVKDSPKTLGYADILFLFPEM